MESDESYNALVRDHFEAPRHTPCHAPAAGVIYGEAGGEAEGVWYRLSARVEGSTLVELRFEAYGCPHSVAAASLLSDELSGATLDTAERWTWRSAGDALQVPAEKRGRLLILEDALRSLITQVRARRS